MSRGLLTIPIHPAPAPASADSARALLHQLADLLASLAAGGEGGLIDLRGLPLTPDDFALLRETLGEGEVRAEIDSFGTSTVRETGIAGIWWQTHRNAEGETVTEMLEVAQIPALLCSQPEDIAWAARQFHARLAQPASGPSGVPLADGGST